MLALVFGALIAVVGLTLLYISINFQNDPTKLPGPWGLPVFGHLLFLGNLPETSLAKWKNIYGPIYSLKLANLSAVVLNDAKIIKEAFGFEEFSGRPALLNLITVSDSKGFSFNDAPNNLDQRQFVIKFLQKMRLAKTEHENRIQKEIGAFLHMFKNKCRKEGLSSSGSGLFQLHVTVHKFFQFPVTNSVWITIVGKRFKENDSTLQDIDTNIEIILENTGIINQLALFFPSISRIINILGKNKVITANKKILDFVNQEIQNCKSNYVPKQPKNFTHAYFDKTAEAKNPDSSFHALGGHQVISTREILFGATDTTVSSLDWLLFHMASRLDIQHKLQQEIDNVLKTFRVSDSRMPSLSDQAHMPYTVAVITESLRMSSINPTSVYHRTLKDVYLRGYKILKDTIVIPNLYAAHYDPATWPDPETFIPERFLESDGTPNNSARNTLPFGFGKRKCVGEQIARDQLFLFATSFFQHFSIQHPGAIPQLKRRYAMVVTPEKFDLLIQERFASVIYPIAS